MQKINVIFFICIASFISSKAHCQTIFSNEGKYGIIDDDSEILAVPALYDEIKMYFEPSGDSKRDFRIYVLRKGDKYTYALKQFWNRTYLHRQAWEEIDSIKWLIDSTYYDTLFPLGIFYGGIPKHGKVYQGDTCLSLGQDYYALAYKKNGKSGLITYIRNSKTLYQLHIPGNGLRDMDKIAWRISLEDVQIYPRQVDDVSNIDSKLISFLLNKKYGVINLNDGYEIAPQFDDVLIPSKFERYYFAKKKGLWGMIYMNKNSSDYVVSIPFRFFSIDEISKNLQSVNFYKRQIIKNGKDPKVLIHEKYISCVYQSSMDQQLQFQFIIYEGESFSPIIRNEQTNYFELNKEYIPEKEKHITFTPLINNNPIVQQRHIEYICINKPLNNINDTTLMFFILKRNRDGIRNENHFSDNKIEAESIFIYKYDFSKDSFVSVYDFKGKTLGVNFKIISEFVKTKEWQEIPNNYNADFVLKSTVLENKEFKYEFYSLEGKKIYELISKHLIMDWELVKSYDPNHTYHISPDNIELKFYAEIPGKKKVKKKAVCYYNMMTKQFY